MLEHLEKRAAALLSQAQTVVLSTSGPAGLQADPFPCQANGLRLMVSIPRTSDHWVNLEAGSEALVTTAGWRLHGQVILPGGAGEHLFPAVEIRPTRLDVYSQGSQPAETIDFW